MMMLRSQPATGTDRRSSGGEDGGGSVLRDPGRWRCVIRCLVLAGLTCCCTQLLAAESESATESYVRWEYTAPVTTSSDPETKLCDVLLDPDVFTHSRGDLGDLRLLDASNQPVPYALRVLNSTFRRQSFPVQEYNRAEGAGGASELTLDLKREDLEHNEVEITTTGTEFRRKVEIEGGDDGKTWSSLADSSLVRFVRGDQKINGDAISYSPSRFRYLRIRVFPDPVVDHGPVDIEKVSVVRRVEVKGKMLTFPAQIGPREAVRGQGGPGSAWLIELGGNRVPCERLEVDVDDDEFVRNYYLEAAGPPEKYERFYRVTLTDQGVWRRQTGEAKKPMVATFNEVRASRLKLVVTDFRNPPLRIRAARFSAAARQVVFARPAEPGSRLRLVFGNSQAEPPNYDFARSLPERLETPPARGQLGAVQVSPDYVPPPLPLTERWPWLIYVVLGVISTVLAVIILSLARSAIAVHDAAAGSQSPA